MKSAKLLIVSSAVFFTFQLIAFALMYLKMGDLAKHFKNRQSGVPNESDPRSS